MAFCKHRDGSNTTLGNVLLKSLRSVSFFFPSSSQNKIKTMMYKINIFLIEPFQAPAEHEHLILGLFTVKQMS